MNNNKNISEWDEDIQKSDYTQSTLFDSLKSSSSKTNSLKSLIENNVDDNNNYLSKYIIDNTHNNSSSLPSRHSRHISFNDTPKPMLLTPPVSYKNNSNSRVRRNSLGDLRIPQRVKAAQQGLKVQLGSVREFAKGVDELRQLRSTLESTKESIPWPSEDISSQVVDLCTELDSKYSTNWDSANVLIELASGSGVVPINNDYNQTSLPRSLTTSPANLNSFSDQQKEHVPSNSLNDRQLDILKNMLQYPPSTSTSKEVHFNGGAGANLDEDMISPRDSMTVHNLNTPPSTPLARKSQQSRLRRASRAGLNSFKDLIKQFVGSAETPSKEGSQSNRQSQERSSNQLDSPIQIPPQTLHRKRPSIAQLFNSATRKASSASLQRKSSIGSQKRRSMNLRDRDSIPPPELDAPKEEDTPVQTPTKPKRLNVESRSYSENLSTPRSRISSYRERENENEKINFPLSTPTNSHTTTMQKSNSNDDCKLQLTPDALPQLLGHLHKVKRICEDSLDQWMNIPASK